MIYIILCWYVCFSLESAFEKGESIIICGKYYPKVVWFVGFIFEGLREGFEKTKIIT